jgi:hypothetical protein
MRNRGTLAIGASLILLGVLFFINQLVREAWPLTILAVGLILLVAALIGRVPGLAIPGVINSMLGLIFLWQTTQAGYNTWLYVWPLVPAAVGLGMIIAGWIGMPGRQARFFAWVLFLEGLAFTALGWWLDGLGLLSWPLIIGGLGVMFLLTAFITRAGGMAIPGTILAGLGALFFWQNSSGDWASWAYTWALVPGMVGLGFILASLSGIRSRGLAVVGAYFIFWALLFFAIFAAFFGQNMEILRYWPLLLILLGLWLLGQSFIRRSRSVEQPDH